MFNLEKEVDKWIESVQGNGWCQAERLEELQDHLYCEVERLQEKGMRAEEAFQQATAQMGNADDLRAELGKNDTLLSKIHDMERANMANISKHTGLSPQVITAITLGHSLLFAVAMIVTPLLMENGDSANMVVMGVLLPLWFTTFMLLPGVRYSAQCELRYLKRVFGSTG